jgi:hypothetical protein
MSRGAPRFPLKTPLPEGADRAGAEAWQAQTAVETSIDRLGSVVVQPGGAIGTNDDRAEVLLLAGKHSGFEIEGVQWRVSGVPGAQVEGPVKVSSGFVQFEGIVFAAFPDTNNSARLISVAAGATAVFVNCRFLHTGRLPCKFVDIDATGKAHFIGCVFEPSTTAALNVVVNAGVVGNVYIIGCSNLTGKTHTSVTTIAETT